MTFAVAFHRLVARGAAGLVCDKQGVTLGPLTLIAATEDSGDSLQYRSVAKEIAAAAVHIACGSKDSAQADWFYSRLNSIAKMMSEGRHTLACIAAVHLRLPEPSLRQLIDLSKLARISKYNPNWSDEARDEHGRWTSDGNNPIVPVIEPYSPECLKAITEARKQCVEEYAARGGGLGFAWMRRCIRLLMPAGCGY